MNTYEKLQEEACKDGIDVIDYPFKSKKIKGLYCDGTIAIKDNIDTTTEKACVLAEELGHHYTSVGNIIDMEYTGNRSWWIRWNCRSNPTPCRRNRFYCNTQWR